MPPRNPADRPAPGNTGNSPVNRGRGARGGGRGATRGDNPSTAGGRVAPTRARPPSRGGGPSRNPGQDAPQAPAPSAGPTSNNLSRISPGAAVSTAVLPNPTLADRSMVTIGKIRPNYGTLGRERIVLTNSFEMKISGEDIYHYDDITPETNGPKQSMIIIRALQEQHPAVFTPNVVYDGKKNIFAARRLPLGDTDSATFPFALTPTKKFKVVMKKVQVINTQILKDYAEKRQSWCNEVQVAIMALDVVIRMQPNSKYPYRKKAFYMPHERLSIGSGIQLWRGLFQSVRPVMDRIVINVDLATGVMFDEGPLLRLAYQCLGGRMDQFENRATVVQLLSAASLSQPRRKRDLRKLRDFLTGVRIMTESAPQKVRAIKDVINISATQWTFDTREGETLTVQQYFARLNISLRYPDLICVKVGTDAVIPLECAFVPAGQLVRPDKIPDNLVPDILKFSSKRPAEKLESIKKGIKDIQHGQSDYVRQFGLTINVEPLQVQTRVIAPPQLQYGHDSRQTVVSPRDGAWNMVDKKFFQPGRINRWIIVIFEHTRFTEDNVRELIPAFEKACSGVGIEVTHKGALYSWQNPQGNIGEILLGASQECFEKFNEPPNLIVAILPETAADIYNAVKHFGDVSNGVATQCLKGLKCRRAKDQYWNNVMLKVNGKLGGINVVPVPDLVSYQALIDPHNPTIVMGADVIHPAPGVLDRPSFAALVANVDKHTAKYVTTTTVQKGRVEIIQDLKGMSRRLIKMYMSYRRGMEKQDKNNLAPKRLIFYRDGVSEGQFREVLDKELAMLKETCRELNIDPKITYIIAAKRHHNQLFPLERDHADKSNNCAAGTVTDRELSHPLEFDFILQSHAGILGTSRPCHYNVIYDDFGFNSDSIQALSYALCHVYAPSTRAVSIPAPVYYADKVCTRARHHYDPTARGPYGSTDTSTQVSGSAGAFTLDDFRASFKPLHPNQQSAMYFL